MQNDSPVPAVYQRAGHCPVCDADTTFSAANSWYRDHLLCANCRSIPRERALMLALRRERPDWVTLRIHESSPSKQAASQKFSTECQAYIATQFFPGVGLGAMHQGFRNENLERQSFSDACFDLVITQDVMEHVNKPDMACAEIARTLVPGGLYIFTAPTEKGRTETARASEILPNGEIKHFLPPSYHGNPVDPNGSLVTFKYGYDFPKLISMWSKMDVEVLRFSDHHHGIIGDYTEVYVCRKR
ncbi:methyltransferase domain-containing protein [Azospirillum argentinense]